MTMHAYVIMCALRFALAVVISTNGDLDRTTSSVARTIQCCAEVDAGGKEVHTAMLYGDLAA